MGKSTVCYPIWGDKEVTWDEKLPPYEWLSFSNEIQRLLLLIRNHWSATAAARMNERSLKKMSAVARMPADPRGPFMQTGFVQRGLGFGWRLNDLGLPLEEMDHFFEIMPVSLGVVFLNASEEELLKRNKKRLQNPETRHENRSYQVPLMMPAIERAKEVLRDRRINVYEIDVEHQSEEDSRSDLKVIASGAKERLHPMDRRLPTGKTMLSPPLWWQS